MRNAARAPSPPHFVDRRHGACVLLTLLVFRQAGQCRYASSSERFLNVLAVLDCSFWLLVTQQPAHQFWNIFGAKNLQKSIILSPGMLQAASGNASVRSFAFVGPPQKILKAFFRPVWPSWGITWPFLAFPPILGHFCLFPRFIVRMGARAGSLAGWGPAQKSRKGQHSTGSLGLSPDNFPMMFNIEISVPGGAPGILISGKFGKSWIF